ncbi:MAG: RNA-binding protein [Limnochordaceae bacterium]|uniref:RNA-binding protein n=1 Tax=Carboxydichorda subterranea TaxID=3109565 RepID=A0ABZ1BZD7_9FIRM|nr:RNA-binding protein [Limnochorda sp. L945t]MBE3598842.1 RNA-binding protein [Limnochordaceae bacterium]WRP17900.1 RNA-binding protein [Limnochorda sp. L945t]
MAKTLFFGNLPWSVTSEELTRLISEHAEVISARVITDRETGRSRGFGFVEVPDEVAESIIETFNGYDLNGRQLTVNEAQPRPERGDNGGGRGGRFGGDRRGPRRSF